MDAVWAKVLKRLRENGEHSLFSLVSNLNGVEFTDGSIIITTVSSAEYGVLIRNRAKLNKLAGGDYVAVELSSQNKAVNENLAALQAMFGGKLRR